MSPRRGNPLACGRPRECRQEHTRIRRKRRFCSERRARVGHRRHRRLRDFLGYLETRRLNLRSAVSASRWLGRRGIRTPGLPRGVVLRAGARRRPVARRRWSRASRGNGPPRETRWKRGKTVRPCRAPRAPTRRGRGGGEEALADAARRRSPARCFWRR